MGISLGFLALGALGLGVSASQTAKANRETRKVVKAQQQQQTFAAQRSRRQFRRQQIVARARSINAAAGTGGLESSSFFGGQSSLSSQFAEGLGFNANQTNLSREIGSAQTAASQYAQRAQLGSGIGQFGINQFFRGFDSSQSFKDNIS